MWDLIVSVPDHCLSFYFSYMELQQNDLVYILLANLTKNTNIECHMIRSEIIQVQSKWKIM